MSQETTDLYLCDHAFQKFWEKLYIMVFTKILVTMVYFTKTSFVFRKVIPLNMPQFNYLKSMHKFVKNQIPSIFSDLIKKPDYKNLINFSQPSFYLKRYSLNSTKHSISIRGSKLQNDLVNKEEERIQSYSVFQKKKRIKSKLIEIEDETDYF